MRDILRLSMPSDDYSPSPYILWATLGDGWASHLDYMGNPMPNHKKMTIGACTTLLLPEQIHTILRRDSASLTVYYQDAESVSNRIDEYWALTPAQTVTSADVSISEDDLPKLLELLQSEKTLDLTPTASPPVSKPQAAPASGPVPATAVPTLPPAAALLVTRHKLRTNSLDAPIKKAVKAANSLNTGAVYLELRTLALNCESPFTGTFDGDALLYTKDDNKTVAKLSKKNLGKRLKTHSL